MSKNKHLLSCTLCNTEFKGYRTSDKFCSSYCRWRSSFLKRTEKAIKRRQEYQKKWGLDNWKRKRDYTILRMFGITSKQYEELLKKQNYSCAICGRHETEFAKKLAIDHDHQTNEIFGLLCNNCNHRFIGKFRDPALFVKAAEYLKQGSGWFVPVRTKKRKGR